MEVWYIVEHKNEKQNCSAILTYSLNKWRRKKTFAKYVLMSFKTRHLNLGFFSICSMLYNFYIQYAHKWITQNELPPIPFSSHTYFSFRIPKGIGCAANTPCNLTNTLCFESRVIGSPLNILELLFLFLVSYLNIYWLYRQYPLHSFICLFFVSRGIGSAPIPLNSCNNFS